MSMHRDDLDPHSGRRHVFQWVVYLICGAVLVTMVVGVAVSMTSGPEPSDASQSLVDPSPTPEPKDSETVSSEATQAPETKAFPIDPKCWESRPAAEITGCQESVAGRTKYAPRYQTNQKSLAAKHPVVKQADTGREANSLARHGLLTCWLVSSSKYSLDDIRAAFYLWFHKHQFSVPNDDLDAAADNIISIAIQEVCPSEAKTLERKGGPKAELVSP
jgi:cytoskeletal protein RodZ